MYRIEFKDLDETIECYFKCLEKLESDYPTISVYGKYDVIKNILEKSIIHGASIIDGIELEDYEVDYYDKEFILCLEKYDSITVSVQKAWYEDNQWHKAGYFDGEADIAFVHADCNSKLLKHIESDIIYEFEIGEEDCAANIEAVDSCSECNCDEDQNSPQKYVKYFTGTNDDMHGFTASKSDGNSYRAYSFYTTSQLSKADIQSLMQEAGF